MSYFVLMPNKANIWGNRVSWKRWLHVPRVGNDKLLLVTNLVCLHLRNYMVGVDTHNTKIESIP